LNYKINIPEKWKTHLSRLELALEDQDPKRSKKPVVFLDEEGEEEREYQISSVVEHRLIRGREDAKKTKKLQFRGSRGECKPIVTKRGTSQIPIHPKRIRADVSNSR
jgi:hypothetical protein